MNNINTGIKLIIGFGLSLLLTLIVGGLSWKTMNKVDHGTTVVETTYMPLLAASGEIEKTATQALSNFKDYFIYNDESLFNTGMQALQKSLDSVKKLQEQVRRDTHLTPFTQAVTALDTASQAFSRAVDRAVGLKRVLEKKRVLLLQRAEDAQTLIETYNHRQLNELARTAGQDFIDRERLLNLRSLLEEGAAIQENIAKIRISMNWAQAVNSFEEAKKVPLQLPEVFTKLEALKTLTDIPESRDTLKQLETALREYDSSINAFLADWKELDAQTPERMKAVSTFIGTVQALAETAIGTTSSMAGDVSSTATLATRNILLLGGMAIVLVMVIAVILTRIITAPIHHCLRFAEEVAAGNLNRALEVNGSDEMGRLAAALRKMVEVLRNKIDEVTAQSAEARRKQQETMEAMDRADAAGKDAQVKRDAMYQAAQQLESIAHIVSSASQQLSAQIEQSEKGAAHQAFRVSETATAMEVMNGMVADVARNAEQASLISAQTRSKAEEGAQVVRQAIAGIQQVQRNSLSLKNGMAKLDEHAQSISQIMSVISDIADQTNLLALNAAIEAARAGEAGRGFAVVADEVRKLAEKTMISTTDVGNAIRGIQQSARESMEQVDIAVESIEQATALAVRSGEALHEIVELVDRTAAQVRNIATASEQQSTSSEAINESIAEVNAIAGETAKTMEESAQAISELAGQTQKLSGLIYKMKEI